MRLSLLFILLKSYILFFIDQKLIEVDVIDTYHSYIASFDINTVCESIKLQIDLNTPYNIINIHRYPDDFLSSLKEKARRNVLIDEEPKEGNEYEINLRVTNQLIPLSFFVLDKPDVKYDDSISLSFLSYDDNFSLINTLYRKKIISYKRFSFVKDNENIKLILGGIPSEYMNTKYKGTCKVVNKKYWGCNLTQVNLYVKYDNRTSSGYFMNKKENDYYSLFQTNSKQISVPSRYYDFLHQSYMKQMINQEVCNLNPDKQYVCKSSFVSNLSFSLELDFDGMSLQLDTKDLFEDNGVWSSLIIKRNDNPNEWKIGTGVLHKLNILFDYDDKSISFYSNENTITESKLKTEIKRNKNISISCIKTNIVMLMMINFYLLFLKYYK